MAHIYYRYTSAPTYFQIQKYLRPQQYWYGATFIDNQKQITTMQTSPLSKVMYSYVQIWISLQMFLVDNPFLLLRKHLLEKRLYICIDDYFDNFKGKQIYLCMDG